VPSGARLVPWARMGIGLLQGLALLALYQAAEEKTWPATNGLIFAPLVTTAVFVPVLIVSGLGNLRLRTLIVWSVVAALACASLAIYDIYRDPVVSGAGFIQLVLPRSADIARTTPSWILWFSLAVMLFIVHALTVAGEVDRRVVASYPTHFDVSWKHGMQFVLAVLFVAVLWGLLFLGAELFRLIRIEFLWELIRRREFAFPVTALAFNYAVHITDVRANIVQGARTLTLILLSWLLPVMVALSAAFVLALPFTGLEPLWGTRRASGILLTAAVALVFLINAAYQDGRSENRAVAVLRYAGALAAIVLILLVALAAYGLRLRIGEYGLTPERVNALALVVVATFYGVGYVVSMARSGTSLKGLETTNLVTSLVIVGVLLALRSPLADPARLSVADQVSRLENGQIAADKFDFAFLRFRAGRYGMDALQQLAAHAVGPQADLIAARAGDMLAARYPSDVKPTKPFPTALQQRADNIVVIQPSGAALPEAFLQRDWSAFQRQWMLPRCLVASAKCEAVLADLDGDGQPEILLFSQPFGAAAAFKSGAGGDWEFLGPIANVNCPGVRDALRAGHFETAQPLLKEIDVSGQRLRVTTDCVPAAGAR